MSKKSLTILAIADLHYTGLARPAVQSASCRGELSRTLLKKVFLRLSHQGVKPDVAVLLGDLVENGDAPGADLDLLTLHGELTRSGIPFIALPGNHDGPPDAFNARFATPPGLYPVNGHGLVVMSDSYAENHEPTRPGAMLSMLRKIRKANPDMPLIALQHTPVYPPVGTVYPYRPSNAAQVMDSFRRYGVVLSLSGHYHPGQKPRLHENVLYHTVPALCEAPFPFSLITVEDGKIEIDEQSLTLPMKNLTDCHCHTEHAYCGTTADTAPIIELSRALGLSSLCLTEHAFQLYFNRHDAMRFRWQSRPEMVEAAWASPGRGRMAAYRTFIEKVRSPFVKIGLELDLYDDDKLLLAPQDETGWDILIGAVHSLQGYKPGETGQAEAEALFLRAVEALVGYDIHVLAHPFRFFARNGLARPAHLYETVADLLRENGVAAELSFHTYKPDLEFIKVCLKKGVPIALASDTHDLAQAGEFWPHIQALKQAGLAPKSFPDHLFAAGPSPRP